MEDGKRLENLSWRLWNRETFCCAPETQARSAFSPPRSFVTRSQPASFDTPLPALSSSLESVSEDDSEDGDENETEQEQDHRSSGEDARMSKLPRNDSQLSRSRGREKHITPIDLQKIVISIKETQHLEPLELPRSQSSLRPLQSSPTSATSHGPTPQLRFDSTAPSQPSIALVPNPSASQPTLLESSTSTVGTNDSSESQQTVGSQESSSTEMSTHRIIRGFVPGGAPSSYRSQTNLAAQPTRILKKPSQPTNMQHSNNKKKGATFTIGTSSGEEESSLESHMYRSSLSESLKRSSNLSKKPTPLTNDLTVLRAAEESPVFESDDEDDDAVSESAIEDDDDSSDWEDSDDQSGPSSMVDKELFQRVDSRPNLTSRRSLLTTLMHEPDRAKALSNAASRSTPAMRRSRTTTPNGPSVATSPESGIEIPGEATTTVARPIIMTTSNTHQPQLALSPRTTRRNMLSSEMTESLRKNLLWERQHRSNGNLAALKRRHTSNDVKNLKQHAESGLVPSNHAAQNYTNDYFHAGLGEYHSRGW